MLLVPHCRLLSRREDLQFLCADLRANWSICWSLALIFLRTTRSVSPSVMSKRRLPVLCHLLGRKDRLKSFHQFGVGFHQGIEIPLALRDNPAKRKLPRFQYELRWLSARPISAIRDGSTSARNGGDTFGKGGFPRSCWTNRICWRPRGTWNSTPSGRDS